MYTRTFSGRRQLLPPPDYSGTALRQTEPEEPRPRYPIERPPAKPKPAEVAAVLTDEQPKTASALPQERKTPVPSVEGRLLTGDRDFLLLGGLLVLMLSGGDDVGCRYAAAALGWLLLSGGR